MSLKYRVRITKNELENFSHARLQISVGQPYHEDEKFLATTTWMAANSFDKISINLCDTLQRHNLVYHGYSPFTAFDKALAAGEEWMDRNKEALSFLPNANITRWENWKKDVSWPSLMEKTNQMYGTDPRFYKLVEESVEAFWERRRGKEGYPEERKNDFFSASRNYILEEIAVSMIMSADDIAEIYPGTFPLPLYYLRENNIPAPLSMTTIAFMKKKSKNTAKVAA